MTPNGEQVICSGLGRENPSPIIILDSVTGNELKRLSVPEREPRSALSSDGQLLAAGCNDGGIYVFELGTGKQIGSWRSHYGEVKGLAFTPDGRHLVSGAWEGVLRISEVPTGRLVAQVTHPAGTIDALAVSPDGKCAVTGGGYTVRGQSQWTDNGDYRLYEWRLPTRTWPKAY